MSFDEFAGSRLAALLRFAVVLTHDRGLAEDVCQDVLLRAHKRWDSIGQMASPEAYVRRMIVNEYLSWRRKWSRFVPRPDIYLDRTEPDVADQHIERARLADAIAKLPPRQRAAIVLRYFEEMADGEIAEIMNCEPSTVRGYVWRALRALRIDVVEGADDATVSAALTRKDT